MEKPNFLALLLLSVLPLGLWAQSFTALYSDLDELDRLTGLQQQTQEQQKNLLDSLELRLNGSLNTLEESNRIIETSNQTIKDLRGISEAQGEYVNRLQEQLRQAELIRQAQLKYQKGLGLELKLWKAGTIAFSASTLVLLIWKVAGR